MSHRLHSLLNTLGVLEPDRRAHHHQSTTPALMPCRQPDESLLQATCGGPSRANFKNLKMCRTNNYFMVANREEDDKPKPSGSCTARKSPNVSEKKSYILWSSLFRLVSPSVVENVRLRCLNENLEPHYRQNANTSPKLLSQKLYETITDHVSRRLKDVQAISFNYSH